MSDQPQRAQGTGPMCSWACTDAARQASQSPLLRLTPCTASSASGSPAPLTTPGEMYADQRPLGVLTCKRRHAPVAGPGESRLCPDRVCSPVGAGTCGQRDCPGARAPPLPRRPTCDTHCRSWPLLSPSVYPPTLWHTGRGGNRRRNPARGGPGGYRGARTARRGSRFSRCRAPSGADTACERRAAWLL